VSSSNNSGLHLGNNEQPNDFSRRLADLKRDLGRHNIGALTYCSFNPDSKLDYAGQLIVFGLGDTAIVGQLGHDAITDGSLGPTSIRFQAINDDVTLPSSLSQISASELLPEELMIRGQPRELIITGRYGESIGITLQNSVTGLRQPETIVGRDEPGWPIIVSEERLGVFGAARRISLGMGYHAAREVSRFTNNLATVAGHFIHHETDLKTGAGSDFIDLPGGHIVQAKLPSSPDDELQLGISYFTRDPRGKLQHRILNYEQTSDEQQPATAEDQLVDAKVDVFDGKEAKAANTQELEKIWRISRKPPDTKIFGFQAPLGQEEATTRLYYGTERLGMMFLAAVLEQIHGSEWQQKLITQ
jgi:hypothetical protein